MSADRMDRLREALNPRPAMPVDEFANADVLCWGLGFEWQFAYKLAGEWAYQGSGIAWPDLVALMTGEIPVLYPRTAVEPNPEAEFPATEFQEGDVLVGWDWTAVRQRHGLWNWRGKSSDLNDLAARSYLNDETAYLARRIEFRP